MNCINCDKSIPDGKQQCPYCGTTQRQVPKEESKSRYNIFSAASFLVSLIGLAVYAIICGIVSMALAGIAYYLYDQKDKYTKAPIYSSAGKGFMIAGFIIGIIELVFGTGNIHQNAFFEQLLHYFHW
ncbi:MAG: hypothetical protein GX148_04790 [Clostridiales bacterium]|nr:hypothetical protein [Clostridiales bacterium]